MKKKIATGTAIAYSTAVFETSECAAPACTATSRPAPRAAAARGGEHPPPHQGRLQGGDAARVPDRGLAARRVLARRADPLPDECQPHDRVADDDRGEFLVLVGRWNTRREDEHAAHLHE